MADDLFGEYFGRHFSAKALERLGAGVNKSFAQAAKVTAVNVRGELFMNALNDAREVTGDMGVAKPSASMAGRISNGVAKGKAFSGRMVRKGAKYGLVAGGGALGYTQYRKQQQRSNNALNSVAVTNGGQGFYRNGNF